MQIRYGLLVFMMGFIPGVSAQNVDLNQGSQLQDSLEMSINTLALSDDALDGQTVLDQVLISTKRLESSGEEQPSTLVIDQNMIKAFAGGSVASLLNQIGGIEINGATGQQGQNLGYYVRGGNNRQVLIMVDGAVVSDASSIASDFDLRLLALDQIESISIVRGPSSVLYGSGAATAVIYIKTKQFQSKQTSVTLAQSLGTNRDLDDSPLSGLQRDQSVRLVAGLGSWLFQAQAGVRQADGLSAVAPARTQRDFASDQFGQFNTRAAIKYISKKGWSMAQFFAYDRMRQDFDSFNYQDAPFQSSTQQWSTGGSFYYPGKNSRYEFHDQWSQTKREINTDFPAVYQAINYNADQFISTQWSEKLQTVIGTQGGWSSMDLAQVNGGVAPLNTVFRHRDSRTYFIDSYLNMKYSPIESLSIDLGGRWHHHMRYGNQGVYQVSPKYTFSNSWGQLSLYGRYGTAFIAPSLYQLYDPIYGNQALDPEFNTSGEIGLIWQKNNAEFAFRWFQRHEEQAVFFALLDPDLYVYQYDNSSEDQYRYGLEIEGKVQPTSWLNMVLFYTYVGARDFELLRVPPHKLNWHIYASLNDREKLSIRWTWSDVRRDQFFDAITFTSSAINLRPYHWVDLVYSAELNEGLSAQLSMTNLLSQEAQPLYRYSGQGRNIMLGLRWASRNN